MPIILFLIIISSTTCAQIIIYPSKDNNQWVNDSITPQAYPFLEKDNLVKTGISVPLLRQSSFTPYWIAAGLDITAEHKLFKAVSVIGSVETNINFSRGAQLYNIEIPVGFRYYFSLGKQMKKRLNPHNFFSHYVAIQTHNTLLSVLNYSTNGAQGPRVDLQKYYRGTIGNQITNNGLVKESLTFLNYVFFQAGSQFKISSNNYLDINVAIPFSIYTKHKYTLTTPALISVKYGIIW